MICACVIFLTKGMFLLASCLRKNNVFDPCVLVTLWPFVMLPNSLVIVFAQVSFANGLVANFSKLVIVLPVSRWMTWFAKCSHDVCFHSSEVLVPSTNAVEDNAILKLGKSYGCRIVIILMGNDIMLLPLECKLVWPLVL